MGAIKPKVLNKMAKIGYGHLCLREENLSFDNNYIKMDHRAKEMQIILDTIFIKTINCKESL